MDKKIIIVDGSAAGWLTKEECRKLLELLDQVAEIGFRLHINNIKTLAE